MMELRHFGFTPGDYWASKGCRDCGCQLKFVTKRSFRCMSCAEKAQTEFQRRQDCPHICDLEPPYVG